MEKKNVFDLIRCMTSGCFLIFRFEFEDPIVAQEKKMFQKITKLIQ